LGIVICFCVSFSSHLSIPAAFRVEQGIEVGNLDFIKLTPKSRSVELCLYSLEHPVLWAHHCVYKLCSKDGTHLEVTELFPALPWSLPYSRWSLSLCHLRLGSVVQHWEMIGAPFLALSTRNVSPLFTYYFLRGRRLQRAGCIFALKEGQSPVEAVGTCLVACFLLTWSRAQPGFPS
jgi:hypothetical protein